MLNQNKKRVEAGRRGGAATLARHGVQHFKKIGSKGAEVFHTRYKLVPIGQNDFAIVNRESGKLKAYLSGMSFEK